MNYTWEVSPAESFLSLNRQTDNTDRQDKTDRQTDRETDIQSVSQSVRQTDRQTEIRSRFKGFRHSAHPFISLVASLLAPAVVWGFELTWGPSWASIGTFLGLS